jgi:phosphatidylserine decarboxylase
MTLHREGFGIVGGYGLFYALLIALMIGEEAPELAIWVVGVAGFIILVLFAQFFRIPRRSINTVDGEIVCPSDGKIVIIDKVHEPEFFKDERMQVSIFMSPLNVHAQWTPMPGIIRYGVYHAGKYLVAWHPKSSTQNERTTIVVENEKGVQVMFRQIAGAVARRIRYYVKAGDKVEAGENVGFIKFGSRIDLYLPLDADIKVDLDQKVKGRETVLAVLK